MKTIHVVTSTTGIVLGAYSKPRKAQARKELAERECIGAFITEVQINEDAEDGAQESE